MEEKNSKMPTIKLTDEEREAESVLCALIDRAHQEPNEKNLESLFNALKKAFVYIPAAMMIDEDEKQRMIMCLKNKQQFTPDPKKTRLAFALKTNKKTGQVILPVFSRLEEMQIDKEEESKQAFARMPFVQAMKMADTIEQAFDVAFDYKTHPIIIPLDNVYEGIGLEL